MEKDTELAEFIVNAISTSNDSLEALDKVLKFKREKRGLMGFHVSPSLDIICGTRKVENPEEEAEKIAKDTLLILLESARGKLKEVDISHEVL